MCHCMAKNEHGIPCLCAFPHYTLGHTSDKIWETPKLTTSLLLILHDAMPKLTIYSTMLFWKTSVGDFIQIMTASPSNRPIGPRGDNTLVPWSTPITKCTTHTSAVVTQHSHNEGLLYQSIIMGQSIQRLCYYTTTETTILEINFCLTDHFFQSYSRIEVSERVGVSHIWHISTQVVIPCHNMTTITIVTYYKNNISM